MAIGLGSSPRYIMLVVGLAKSLRIYLAKVLCFYESSAHYKVFLKLALCVAVILLLFLAHISSAFVTIVVVYYKSSDHAINANTGTSGRGEDKIRLSINGATDYLHGYTIGATL